MVGEGSRSRQNYADDDLMHLPNVRQLLNMLLPFLCNGGINFWTLTCMLSVVGIPLAGHRLDSWSEPAVIPIGHPAR